MINEIGWCGEWSIVVKDRLTKEIIEETKIKNKIMNQALEELLKVLKGESTDLKISHMALGTSNTPLTTTQTQLGDEIFRTPFVTQSKTDVAEITTIFAVLDDEAVAQIEEVGLFGGSTSSNDPNTGTLISRVLWSRNKTANEEIQFNRIDRMVRA